ncbi:CGNR zinc finger domain-containing protein [Propionibacteriaceae bacterium Y1700]|uniref:CGNR zinc finger domain-containing protein n=1 Tax=Microlunatus sp. Y1700 TaxID=3418487 RepID=UPI003DA79456
MHLNPYGEEPVLLAADLSNDPPTTAADLTERCQEAGLHIELPATRADVAAVAELLDDWVGVVDASSERERARLLNAMLATWAEHPRLTDHADGWHLHYRPDRAKLSRILATLISVGTALHLTGRGMGRLGRCGASDCDRVFADVSRNGTQRWCSTRCGNRSAVRRHRAKAIS